LVDEQQKLHLFKRHIDKCLAAAMATLDAANQYQTLAGYIEHAQPLWETLRTIGEVKKSAYDRGAMIPRGMADRANSDLYKMVDRHNTRQYTPSYYPGDRRTHTGRTYGGQGQPMDLSQIKDQAKDKKDIECWNCGKKGHYSSECRSPKKVTPQVSNPNPPPRGRVPPRGMSRGFGRGSGQRTRVTGHNREIVAGQQVVPENRRIEAPRGSTSDRNRIAAIDNAFRGLSQEERNRLLERLAKNTSA
jgi:hypothetical protein